MKLENHQGCEDRNPPSGHFSHCGLGKQQKWRFSWEIYGNFPRHGDQASSSPPAVNPITIISITGQKFSDGSGQKYKSIKIDDLRFGDIWGFLKMGDPHVTIAFETKSWSNDLDGE